MGQLSLKNVIKTFGDFEVVKNVSLDVQEGEFIVFVGPSGCGKSTLLRMISGLETVTSGTIAIEGEVVNDVEPARRGAAMVFQSYALYPHMTIFQNVSFGLRMAHRPRDFIADKVNKAATILKLDRLLDRKPAQLSGGQKQRVAIGRAIVRKPEVFLFDEPLSNLDAALRMSMRVEFSRLHRELGTTMIYVTHDQVEAMTLADRIVVMRDGRILQVGAPMELYEKPADVFTARFIGSPTMNILPARATTAGATTLALGEQPLTLPSAMGTVPADLLVGVRPQQLRVLATGETSDLVLSGKAAVIEPLGSETFVHVEHGGGLILASASAKAPPVVGETVRLGAPVSALTLFDAASERAL